MAGLGGPRARRVGARREDGGGPAGAGPAPKGGPEAVGMFADLEGTMFEVAKHKIEIHKRL